MAKQIDKEFGKLDVIAGVATGADEGFIYTRAEYPLAIKTLEKAIAVAYEKNLLGDDILGSGHNFHLKLRKGAGAFVCGESTALMASLDEKRIAGAALDTFSREPLPPSPSHRPSPSAIGDDVTAKVGGAAPFVEPEQRSPS